MKLASLRDGTRDGRLIVVSRDLKSAAPVPHARTLQAALDQWDESLAEMLALSERLDRGRVSGTLEFNPAECLSPLPRAYQWVQARAWPNHEQVLLRAHGVGAGERQSRRALMVQGGSDAFLAPTEDIFLAEPGWACDLEAGIAVVTTDIAAGADSDQAASAIRLVMLFNDLGLRPTGTDAALTDPDPYQAQLGAAFSPVAVTPDELGAAWNGRKLHGRLRCFINGAKLGEPDAGVDMRFDFGDLLAHAARTGRLSAGSIFGAGPVSNAGDDGGPAKPLPQGGPGYASISEARAAETLLQGAPMTAFLGSDDSLRIDMLDAERLSIFGAIEQRVLMRDAR